MLSLTLSDYLLPGKPAAVSSAVLWRSLYDETSDQQNEIGSGYSLKVDIPAAASFQMIEAPANCLVETSWENLS